jgi:hypothetical protein
VLGDIDCDGFLTAIDASVVLGLFVGNIADSDLPPPCDDPDHRLAVSDWDLSGTINPIDASATLAVFVGSIDECDTPLGQSIPGLCPPPLDGFTYNAQEGVIRTASPLTLTVSVETLDPIVPGQTGVVVTIAADESLTVGSTDITLNWDVAGIQVDRVFSSVLSSFASSIDNANRTVVTASASSGSDDIPAGTTLMTFLLTANEPGVYNLFIRDGDGIAPDDLAGPVPPIPPVSIPYTAVSASLNVTEATPTATPNATPTPEPPRTGKVTLCHEGRQMIQVSVNALPAHRAHGDTLGECVDPATPTATSVLAPLTRDQ